jgi:hypothetical protein
MIKQKDWRNKWYNFFPFNAVYEIITRSSTGGNSITYLTKWIRYIHRERCYWKKLKPLHGKIVWRFWIN